jgi:hypothetical protein
MLQIKCWAWNINLPNGKGTPMKIQSDINIFLKNHTCIDDTFSIIEMSNGIMFANILYRTNKK